MLERAQRDSDDVVTAGGRGGGENRRQAVRGEVRGIGVVAAAGDGWCVGCIVGSCLEIDGCLLVVDRAEELGEVAERRPLLDPAAGAGPVLDKGAVTVVNVSRGRPVQVAGVMTRGQRREMVSLAGRAIE